MIRLLIFIFLLGATSISWAETAKCTIEIEDINSGSKYTVEQNFHLKTGTTTQKKHFALPGSQYSCTLAFFDLRSGTMLSCEDNRDMGHSFIQSDRSTLVEGRAKNNLTFRNKDYFFSLSAHCK